MRIDQQKRGRRPKSCDIHAQVGAKAGAWRHSRLRIESRKWRGKTAANGVRQGPVVHSLIFYFLAFRVSPAGRWNHGASRNVLSVVTRLIARCPCLQTVRACLRPGTRSILSRRTFLATGAAAGIGGAAWLSVSSLWVPAAPHKPAPASWSDNAVTLAWLGHATVLINFYGMRILTDPVLFSRIGVDMLVGSIGPLRLVQCALTPDEIPHVDLVLVSHAHFDHLDTPSLASVRGKPAAVMAAETSDLLPRRRYSSVTELRWNESTKIRTGHGEALVRSIEVKHWGARIRRDTYRGYTGFIVEREDRKLLIGATRPAPTRSASIGGSGRLMPPSCRSARTTLDSQSLHPGAGGGDGRRRRRAAVSCPCTTSASS